MAEYVIEKVSDFLKIPKDRLPVCLDELKDVLGSCHAMMDLVGHVDESINGKKSFDLILPRLIWKDEQEKKLVFNFKT